MDIVLATNDPENEFALRDIRRGEANTFACQLEVRSDGFRARVPFWPEQFVLEQFLGQIREMDRTLTGEALLQPMCEPEFVRMQLERSGSISVSGEIGSDVGNHLRFGWRTDQTVLAPLIRDLERALLTVAPAG